MVLLDLFYPSDLDELDQIYDKYDYNIFASSKSYFHFKKSLREEFYEYF